jgi:hypothetical protein
VKVVKGHAPDQEGERTLTHNILIQTPQPDSVVIMGICPLLKSECLKNECEWWESVDKKCAILLLAYTTDIRDVLENLETR